MEIPALAEAQLTLSLMPVYVPASFLDTGNWPGPYRLLKAIEVGLTWALKLPDQQMRYLDFETQHVWEEHGVDWQSRALENLRAHTQGDPGVLEMPRATGELDAIAFMNGDGLGPSRLLLREMLRERFPNGYLVAIPEMSCGLAFAKDAAPDEREKIESAIEHCYRQGSRPVSPLIYEPEELF